MDYRKKRRTIIVLIFLIIFVLILAGIFMYKKFNSNEYKLEKLGYSTSDIEIILKNNNLTVNEVLNMEYDENLIKIINEKYFIKSNLNDYLEYMKTKPKIEELDTVTPTDIVAIVNVRSDKPFYTDPIATDVSKGILMLVNKFNYLTNEYVPENLITMGLEFAYDDKQVIDEAYNSFRRLVRDARDEELIIIANSSYRSYENQEIVYQQKKSALGETEADLIALRPGFSEHQTGYSIDVSTPGYTSKDFDTSDEFKWLQENSYKYGFILRYPKNKKYITGIEYESWHYRYVGVEVATKIYEENITFDEYYEYYLR